MLSIRRCVKLQLQWLKSFEIWLEGIDIQINLIPYHQLPSDKKKFAKNVKIALSMYTIVVEK